MNSLKKLRFLGFVTKSLSPKSIRCANTFLAAAGIKVSIGHERYNVGQIDLVARSTAVADENIEIREARDRGIPVVSRADLLSAITRIKPTVSVAGTHGKTTTSSMLAVLLAQANLTQRMLLQVKQTMSLLPFTHCWNHCSTRQYSHWPLTKWATPFLKSAGGVVVGSGVVGVVVVGAVSFSSFALLSVSIAPNQIIKLTKAVPNRANKVNLILRG